MLAMMLSQGKLHVRMFCISNFMSHLPFLTFMFTYTFRLNIWQELIILRFISNFLSNNY